MKALCITGADNATLKTIATPFYTAGMQKPKNLLREQEVSITTWHAQVNEKLSQSQPIGKLWENLASDLLLANLDSTFWGWYDEKSVSALHFWAEMEPNIHFLLVCTRPEEELHHKLRQSDSMLDTEACIKEWYERHQLLLNFYLQYPQRCLLIDAQDALQHVNHQLRLAHDHWQLPLDQRTADQIASSSFDIEETPLDKSSIISLVAREALKQTNTDISGFFAELRAAQYPLTDPDKNEAVTRQLLHWLHQDIDTHLLNNLLAEFQHLQHQAALAEKLPLLQDQSNDTLRELEQAHLTGQSQQQQLQQLQDVLDKGSKANQALTAEKEKLVQQLNDNKQENELLLLQLHQVQEELESYFLKAQDSEKKQAALQGALNNTQQTYEQESIQLKQTIAALESELKEANKSIQKQVTQPAQRIQELESELKEAKQNNEYQLKQLQQTQEELKRYFGSYQTINETTQQQLSESKQENELLLLQLHQVQEELESYFLQNQKQSNEVQRITQEYESLLKELYQTQESLEEQVLENTQLNRKITQLETINQHFNKNWLSRMMRPKVQDSELIYDDVELIHEQVNVDYEHLWINLKQPVFGLNTAKQWTFRVSCAAIKPDSFGQQPKLEFPEQKDQLLNQWFEESISDQGSKLELRFALPNSMDKQVWLQIDKHDQKLIRSLIKQLPLILNKLSEKRSVISRDWKDWKALVEHMNRIINAKASK